MLSAQLSSVPSSSPEQHSLRLQLARLLLDSEAMLEQARLGEWETVQEMERERRGTLEACLANALEIEASELIREAVAALLHLNEQMAVLVGRAREETLAKRGELEKGKTAINIYTQR